MIPITHVPPPSTHTDRDTTHSPVNSCNHTEPNLTRMPTFLYTSIHAWFAHNGDLVPMRKVLSRLCGWFIHLSLSHIHTLFLSCSVSHFSMSDLFLYVQRSIKASVCNYESPHWRCERHMWNNIFVHIVSYNENLWI